MLGVGVHSVVNGTSMSCANTWRMPRTCGPGGGVHETAWARPAGAATRDRPTRRHATRSLKRAAPARAAPYLGGRRNLRTPVPGVPVDGRKIVTLTT